jgi:hypothetical protein
VPDRPLESYDRLLVALKQLLEEAQRVGDVGVREWASLAMLDAIDLAEELGIMRGGEATRRRRRSIGVGGPQADAGMKASGWTSAPGRHAARMGCAISGVASAQAEGAHERSSRPVD